MREILLLTTLGFSLYVGHSIDTINENATKHFANSCSSNVCREVDRKPLHPSISPAPTKTPAIPRDPAVQVWTGKVSHYSVAGCLGCSPTLTMANGEVLSDSRATIAFNWLPMNTRVRVTNLDNGKSIEAIVTDTGGFNSLGRIADLTPAVSGYLETKTDVSEVKIEVL